WGSGRRRDHVHLLRERKLNGRRVLEVAIDRPGDPGREWLLVDAETDLPVRTEEQRQVAGRWRTEFLTEYHYSEPLPARLFTPDFPPSARIVDWEANRQRWERRLAPGIVRKRVGDRTIVIRDFQVCSEGDIFVLYTAGRHPGDAMADWSKELTDDRRGKYQNAGLFQPYMEGNLAPPAGPGY